MRPTEPPFQEVLGVRVQALTIDLLQDRISVAIGSNGKVVIGHHNLNSVRLFHRDPLMRQFYERCERVHIDGMPMVWWARLLGRPIRGSHRVTYVDWMPRLMRDAAQAGWRIFYLGSRPGVAEKAADHLRRVHQGLQIRTHHGYFDADDPSTSDEILREVADFDTNLLMVGMGMPRQEHWIIQNLDALSVNVVLPCGAAFDYVAGQVRTPPRWMGRVGIEWLYRLCGEPGRLWRRYLVEPWALVPWMVRDARIALRARFGTAGDPGE